MSVNESENERSRLSILSAIVALRSSFYSMRGVIWQPFVLSLGFSMKSLGGLESFLDFSRLLIQPIVGGASDAQGRRRWLLLRDVLTVTIAILSIFAGSTEILLILVLVSSFEGAIQNIWSAMVAESVKPDRIGYIFSILHTSATAAGLVATLLSGYIAEIYGYRSVFIVSTFLAIMSLFLMIFRLPETKQSAEAPKFRFKEAFNTLLQTLKPPRHLWGFYVAMSVDLFAFSIGWRLVSGMLTSGYGYTPQMLGWMSAILTGTMFLSQLVLSRYIDKIGYVRCLASSQILAVIYLGMLVYSKQFEVVLAAQIVMGLAAALWGPAENAWIAKNVNPEERARSMASYSSLRTLASFPAPFIGGLLFDMYGLDIPLLVNMVLAIIDTGLILWLIKDK